ncbi:unnamed protein product, partial [Symbiodinium sp. CCMP2592]
NMGRIAMQDPRDCQRKIEIIAFYFPGRRTDWDCVCGCSFLANFFRLPTPMEVQMHGEVLRFTNAEAAFQALKFKDHAKVFQTLDGEGAFQKKAALRGLLA